MYSSCILPNTDKGQVICWPIHETPTGFSRTFPTFNKSMTYTVWNREVSGHAMLKDHPNTVKSNPCFPSSNRKSRFAATLQGNKKSKQANHKPQRAAFQKSASPQTVPPMLHSLFCLSSTFLSTQIPRRGLPAFPSFCHFSSLLLKST